VDDVSALQNGHRIAGMTIISSHRSQRAIVGMFKYLARSDSMNL
jgi:hypothetical protein